MSIFTDIERLEIVINEALAKEWEAQGHHMTGKIVKEIQWQSKHETNRLILTGFIYPYGKYQASGAKWPNKRPPVGPLQKWVQLRMGLDDDKKSKSIAFAIATALKKNGMPLPGSFKYSSTGKRTDWIEEALIKNDEKISEAIGKLGENIVSTEIDILVKKWNVELNKAS